MTSAPRAVSGSSAAGGACGDVKMCESESKDGFDDLDDLPRKPFVRVSGGM